MSWLMEQKLGVMRIEKGHAAGNELNGQTTAQNLGLEKMMSKERFRWKCII